MVLCRDELLIIVNGKWDFIFLYFKKWIREKWNSFVIGEFLIFSLCKGSVG